MPNQKTNPNQSLIVLAVFLVVVGVGWSAYQLIPNLKTAREDLAQKTAAGQGLDNETASLTDAATTLKNERARLTSRGVNFSMIRAVYPLTEDKPGLYILMDDLTKPRSDLSDIAYTISDPTLNDTSTGVIIPVTVSATGEYSVLIGYINELQRALRPITVAKVSLTKANQASPEDATGGQKQSSGASDTAYTMALSGYVRAESLSSSYAASATPTP